MTATLTRAGTDGAAALPIRPTGAGDLDAVPRLAQARKALGRPRDAGLPARDMLLGDPIRRVAA